MNHVLSLVRTARKSGASEVSLHSDHMLGEFLSLHEETLAQLRREQRGAADLLAFLEDMIAQHERAVRTIRTQLEEALANGADASPPAPPLVDRP
jgi:flagellar biosynthesis chaperone FliJ